MNKTSGKIAFIINQHFSQNHVGIRNYIFNLMISLVKLKYDVSFLYPLKVSNKVHFTEIVFSEDFIFNNGFSNYEFWEGDTKEFINNCLNLNFKYISENDKNYFHTIYAGEVEWNNYRKVIITSPWSLAGFEEIDLKIKTEKLIGIVYDTIPIEYYFSKKVMPGLQSLAYEHVRGFNYYNNFCDAILCISDSCKQSYVDIFPNVKNKCNVLPVITRYGESYQANKNNDFSILLASPFDSRKGLGLLPKFFNIFDDFDYSINIFGDLRCSEDEFKSFAKSLKPGKKIKWHKKASFKTIQNLYNESSIMPFLSEHEGLGLPIVEAQLSACNVVTFDKDPMKDLNINKNLVIESLEKLDRDKILSNLYKSEDMRALADEKFNQLRAQNELKSLI